LNFFLSYRIFPLPIWRPAGPYRLLKCFKLDWNSLRAPCVCFFFDYGNVMDTTSSHPFSSMFYHEVRYTDFNLTRGCASPIHSYDFFSLFEGTMGVFISAGVCSCGALILVVRAGCLFSLCFVFFSSFLFLRSSDL